MTSVHTKDYLKEEGQVWSEDKAKAYRDVFYEFLNYCVIPSKEDGIIALGGSLYPAQERGLDDIFEGLQHGIHDFKWGKGRQQGISTICRPFTTMWIAMHPGSRGAFVLDTAQHMAEARTEIEFTLGNLPAKLKFPKFTTNRYGGKFDNGSTATFLAAGVKSTASSGGLGRGQGINVVHASELCMWGSAEGLVSFRKSLAQGWLNRLFLWESTGRNIGSIWHQMWERAKANDLEEATVFTGWYLIPTHVIPYGTKRFERYGEPPVTKDEQKRIDEVKDRYGWDITREQLAWIRKETNPLMYSGGMDDEDDEDSGGYEEDYGSREDPWTEDEMFTMDGSVFFPSTKLTEICKRDVSNNFQAFTYFAGTDFLSCDIIKAPNPRMTHLKVWEEPDEDGSYVVSGDPAFGSNENNDRSAIQVLRCYADKIEQVAEYAYAGVQPHQFAWILASLTGYYRNARLIIEINGPGAAVWREYSSLKVIVNRGYLKAGAEKKGISDIFNNVKQYIYSRTDALVPGGSSTHWKTQGNNKVELMERLRDLTTNGTLILRSFDTVEELKTIAREGDTIEASGSNHDDRIMALAIGVRCWEEKERMGLITARKTRELEIARKRFTIQDRLQMMNEYQLSRFFQSKQSVRTAAASAARRGSWKNR